MRSDSAVLTTQSLSLPAATSTCTANQLPLNTMIVIFTSNRVAELPHLNMNRVLLSISFQKLPNNQQLSLPRE